MILLENDTVTVKVNKSDRIYEILSKFNNESFIVNVVEEVQPNTLEENTIEEKPQIVKKEVNRDIVWELFNEAFEKYLDPPTMFANILKSHVSSIIGEEKGPITLDMVSPNTYKKENFYLFYKEN